MSAVPQPSLAADRKAFYDKIDKANCTPLWEVLHGLITQPPTPRASRTCGNGTWCGPGSRGRAS